MKEILDGIKNKMSGVTKNPGASFRIVISLCYCCWNSNRRLLCK